MIHDEAQFASVIEEIAAWTLTQRRDYIGEIEKAFGPESAQQIKNGLTARWSKR